MLCPKCEATMENVDFYGYEVRRCKNCKGLWFNAMEHDELRDIQGSETLDTGDEKMGENFNEIDNIRCPDCRSNMIRMVDRRHPHVWFEACTNCYGVFFDAGEFRDFKEDTLGAFVKDLLTPERT